MSGKGADHYSLNSWTERQETILRRQWANPNVTAAEVATEIGRPFNSTRYHAEKVLKLGPKATTHLAWTDDMRDRLRDLWSDPELSTLDIAKQLNVGRNALIGQAHRLKLPVRVSGRKPRVDREPAPIRPSPWTDERIADLQRLWAQGRTATEIARAIGAGLTRHAVLTKANRIGLIRDDATKVANTRRIKGQQSAQRERDEGWTDDRVATLRRMWTAGASSKEIATALRCSEGMVGAKANRIGLKRSAEVIATSSAISFRAQVGQPGAPSAEPPGVVLTGPGWNPLPGIAPVSILDLLHTHCRWPVELQGAEFPHSCGALAVGGPYCLEHTKRSRPRPEAKVAVDQRLGIIPMRRQRAA